MNRGSSKSYKNYENTPIKKLMQDHILFQKVDNYFIILNIKNLFLNRIDILFVFESM